MGDLTLERAQALLSERFGHSGFRPGQEEILGHVLAGVPTLAVMPTGAGKSLCYQLPALMFDGLTVVVSPLIALMQDQVSALTQRGIEAAAMTSASSAEDRRRALSEALVGAKKLLYVAPERFRSPRVIEALAGKIALLAIDEAHCISEWGHDFRPDYARLGGVIDALAPERVIALTATATPEVRADIVRSLGLDEAKIVVTGFDRPNLALKVIDAKSAGRKSELLAATLSEQLGRGSAIVYAATRRRCEEIAATLREGGFVAASYHAGMGAEDRSAVQQRFERGELPVVVATSAFGMGVDKSDVRVVIHHDIPSSCEAYYQEVGRAGRDGEPAAGVLLYDQGDLRYAVMKLEAACPSAELVARAEQLLSARADDRGLLSEGLEELVEALEPTLGPATRAALVELGSLGRAHFGLGSSELCADGLPIDRAALERHARFERAKVDAMIGYVERAPCRRRYLTDYFGDPDAPDRCGACDRCARPRVRTLEGVAREDALKALSCVARMKGRYGKGRVADVLLGSRSKPVTDAGLDALSTYGLLSSYSRELVMALFDSLARAGLVATSFEEYPRLALTKLGAETLKERREIAIDLRLARWGDAESSAPPAPAARPERRSKPDGPALPPPEDAELFGLLRAWRSEEARRAQKPPYVIAHDALLVSLAAARPQDREALGRVSGIGPAKLERYGDELLGLIRAHPKEAR